MGVEIKTKGLVLHEMPIKDYDKRLILLTKDCGKITAFSKGARKPNSTLLAGSQIFSYGEFVLYKGSNSYNVNQVSLIEPFHNLRKDIDTLTYGLYILEFADHISLENNIDHELMKLILKTLKKIENPEVKPELIAKIFELKALSIIGYTPWTLSCVICNRMEDLNFFSSNKGGVVCDTCKDTSQSFIHVSEGTRHMINYILQNPVEKIFKFQLENPSIFYEFNLVMKQFIEYNLNKKFKALEFLAEWKL